MPTVACYLRYRKAQNDRLDRHPGNNGRRKQINSLELLRCNLMQETLSTPFFCDQQSIYFISPTEPTFVCAENFPLRYYFWRDRTSVIIRIRCVFFLIVQLSSKKVSLLSILKKEVRALCASNANFTDVDLRARLAPILAAFRNMSYSPPLYFALGAEYFYIV